MLENGYTIKDLDLLRQMKEKRIFSATVETYGTVMILIEAT